MQVVYREADPSWRIEDWRERASAERDAALEQFLHEDGARGVPLDRPPLMRFALFRTGEDTHRLVWTFHHLLMDAWSIGLVWTEVLRAYADGATGEPAPVVSYRGFVDWLARQQQEPSLAFWREVLADLAAPTRLCGAGVAGEPTWRDTGEVSEDLPADVARGSRPRRGACVSRPTRSCRPCGPGCCPRALDATMSSGGRRWRYDRRRLPTSSMWSAC